VLVVKTGCSIVQGGMGVAVNICCRGLSECDMYGPEQPCLLLIL
jgi:hypothetical protein